MILKWKSEALEESAEKNLSTEIEKMAAGFFFVARTHQKFGLWSRNVEKKAFLWKTIQSIAILFDAGVMIDTTTLFEIIDFRIFGH